MRHCCHGTQEAAEGRKEGAVGAAVHHHRHATLSVRVRVRDRERVIDEVRVVRIEQWGLKYYTHITSKL